VKLHFGELTLDIGARQLARGQVAVHLSPKAFDLLAMLIEQRPRALSKRELHGRLWPDTFVSDANLASLVAEVREALDDDARRPRFIRTAQRFGYAFCGGVTERPDWDPSGQAVFCWLLRDGRRMPLRPGENILGRDEQDIQLDSPTVSRRHARIVISDSDASLEDLGSKNGTFVRGTAVSSPVRLSDGDEIRAGSVVLRFRMTSPKGATATWTGGDDQP
jgi:DNA-binding winged helix-turn-helix (wHTH) protein